MKSQEIRHSFKKAYESYDMYGDRIISYINQDPVRLWLTTKDIVKFNNIDLNGLQYDYIGIGKDQRPEKNDLIDECKVVYKIIVNRFVYLFLQDYQGSDDSE